MTWCQRGIPILWRKNRALSLECWLDLRAEPISGAAKHFKSLLAVQVARRTCSPEITPHERKITASDFEINWNTRAGNKLMQLLAPESRCAQQIHFLLVRNGLLNHSTQQLIIKSVNQRCPLTWNNATTTPKVTYPSRMETLVVVVWDSGRPWGSQAKCTRLVAPPWCSVA